MNRDIRQLEQDLIDRLNQSSVCVEAKRIIVENIMYKLSQEADNIILAEIKEAENAEGTH